jgi:hypothetical protein
VILALTTILGRNVVGNIVPIPDSEQLRRSNKVKARPDLKSFQQQLFFVCGPVGCQERETKVFYDPVTVPIFVSS